MSRYVLLRVDDDDEADTLLRDLVTQPHLPLLTPDTVSRVHVELVPDIDTGDLGGFDCIPGSDTRHALARAVLETYQRAGELAADEAGAA
jgi:hypothetical protein